MNQEEYENKKRELENEDKITKDIIQNAPTRNKMTDEDIEQIVNLSDKLITDKEKEKIIKEEEAKEHDELLQKFGGTNLSNVPELAEFLTSEEQLTLGTHAKIPIPIEVMGKPMKVYIRPLSRKELIECRNRAKAKGHTDVDYEAILMVCTRYDGTPYTEKELNILGYGHMQTIGEAIMIASGESPENTQSAMKEHLVDEFLKKFTS